MTIELNNDATITTLVHVLALTWFFVVAKHACIIIFVAFVLKISRQKKNSIFDVVFVLGKATLTLCPRQRQRRHINVNVNVPQRGPYQAPLVNKTQ